MFIFVSVVSFYNVRSSIHTQYFPHLSFLIGIISLALPEVSSIVPPVFFSNVLSRCVIKCTDCRQFVKLGYINYIDITSPLLQCNDDVCTRWWQRCQSYQMIIYKSNGDSSESEHVLIISCNSFVTVAQYITVYLQ